MEPHITPEHLAYIEASARVDHILANDPRSGGGVYLDIGLPWYDDELRAARHARDAAAQALAELTDAHLSAT